ncbi:MAG TPA: DUF6320 domain-containing protein [Bacilli bacterium]|nr:DUF6320 domain-containing protein [Bacilli bacterium]
MKYCKKCNITLNTQRMTCPLCFTVLEKNEHVSQTTYAPYPGYQPKSYKDGVLVKIFIFLSIVAIFVSAIVNIMTWQANRSPWSIIVIGCVLYGWILIKNTVIAKINIGRKLVFQTIALPILLVIIEKYTYSPEPWALDYVTPFLTVIATVAILMLVFIKSSKYGEYVIYLLNINFLGLIPLILYFVFPGIISIMWPSVVAASIGFLTFLGMWVFAGRATKQELKKRFHI